MNNKLNIGIDFDGVIADTMKLKQRIAQDVYGVFIPSHRFKEYMVIEDGYLNHEQYRHLMNIVCGDRNIGLKMAPVSGSVKYLSILKRNHSLKIITSREGGELEVAREWCAKHNLKLDFISVGYNKDKVRAARSLDIYIDDDLPKLTPLIGKVPRLFLFSQDYNLSYAAPDGIFRISSWKNFMENIININPATCGKALR